MASRKREKAKPGRSAAARTKSKTINGKAKLNGKHSLNGKANGVHVRVSGAKPQPVAPAKGKPASPAGKKREGKHFEIVLPVGYRPSEVEPFMNSQQRVYFRNKLLAWKEEIVRQNRETLMGLHEDSSQHADLADRATFEADRALELRARDRQRKLVSKIDQALARIEDGTYGYCEETGEPISLKRPDARPIATLSLEAQERHERRERVFRED